MSRDIEMHCRCGEVRGIVKDASPKKVTRAICYCDDCQAFAHYLGRADLLDEHGGTDIVQVAPASLAFNHGTDRIVGVRLKPKGLYRWYASCCKTPLGNTVAPGIPFVGIVAQAFDGPDAAFGKPAGAILGRFAIGKAPEGSTKLDFRLVRHALGNILGWKLRGKTWPHPFFDRATSSPIRPLTTISREERDALRAFCGPNPTATAPAASAS